MNGAKAYQQKFQSLPQWVKDDANQAGENPQAALEEFMAGYGTGGWFDQADANGDGKLVRDEFQVMDNLAE